MNELLLQNEQLGWAPLVTGWPLSGVALVLLLVLLASVYGYLRVPPAKRLALLSLRFLSVMVLALVVAGPVRINSEEQQRRDPLAVLIDASRSMRVQDVQGGSRSASVEATGFICVGCHPSARVTRASSSGVVIP